MKLCESCNFVYEDGLYVRCPFCGSELVEHVGVGVRMDDGLKSTGVHLCQSSGTCDMTYGYETL